MKDVLSVLSKIVIGCAVVYLCICVVMHSRLSMIETYPPAELIKNSTDAYDKTAKISEGNVSVNIPTYYSVTTVKQESAIVCNAQKEQRQLLVFYHPANLVLDSYSPGVASTFQKSVTFFKEEDLSFPYNLLIDIPDTLYDAMRETFLTTREDANFFNPISTAKVYTYSKIRRQMPSNIDIYALYEREDGMCGYLGKSDDAPNAYIAIVFPKKTSNNIYSIYMETPDKSDMIKILNGLEIEPEL